MRRFLYAGCFLLFCWGLVDVLVSAPSTPSGADLGLSGTVTPPATVTGSNVIYTIIVTNTGPDEADNVVLTNTLPPQITCVGCDAGINGSCNTGTIGIVTADFPTLTAGASSTLVITGEVECFAANRAVLTNTAIVGSSTNDPDLANNQVSIITTNRNPLRKPVCANTLVFAEDYADRPLCSGSRSDGDYGCDIYGADAFALTAILSLEGVDITQFNEDTWFSVNVGDDYSTGDQLGDAAHYKPGGTSATFITLEDDFQKSGRDIIKLKWSRTQLKVSIKYNTVDAADANDSPILADQYEGGNGPIAQVLSGSITFGNVTGNFDAVYCAGATSTTNKFFRQGGIGEASVTTVKIVGAAAN
jgi:uncharacterized repeat protein (TIGR01451 family)